MKQESQIGIRLPIRPWVSENSLYVDGPCTTLGMQKCAIFKTRLMAHSVDDECKLSCGERSE